MDRTVPFPDPQMQLGAGTKLGPYEVVALIGAGGMGSVYKAHDSRLERDVAIKVLPPEFAGDRERRTRFEREARAVAALNHPHICTIYDIGEHDGQLFLVMEFLKGETLADRLGSGPLRLQVLLDLAVQLANALDAAHAAGIIHRDLKPANVFVTTRGQAKILDFGLAKVTGVPAAGAGEVGTALPTAIEATRLTSPGTALGTVAYMSPEQARGEGLDAKSDLFSFGAVLYEMATGRQAFSGRTSAMIFDEILNKTPAPIDRTGLEVPADLHRIITKALEKDRDLRYHSAGDIRADLKRLKRELESSRLRAQPRASGEGTAAPPAMATDVASPLAAARRRPSGLVAAIVLVGVVAVAAAAWWLIRSPDASERIDSVAVLPFLNGSGSADAEYLSDGLADTVTNSLSQLRTLRVIPRTLVSKYKNQTVDPRQVARELNVRAVVTGRVVQRGDRLFVQAELIDAVSVAQIWGQQFNRALVDAVAVQSEISKSIADALRLQLTGEDEKGLAAGGTRNAEAFQLYLKGRYEWNKRSRDGLSAGTEYFERAIKTDPTYAQAHAGLANVYNMQAFYGVLPSREAFPRAIAAATRAIELDERSADAHVALGWAALRWEWDWARSEREFQRALAIDPGNATAHQWYGAQVLLTQGRRDEAIAECRRGEALDPLSPGLALGSAFTLLFARRQDDAIETLQRALALQPDFTAAHRFLATAYRLKGMIDLAIAEAQRALDLGDPLGQVEHAASLAASGRKREALSLLDAWVAQSIPGQRRGFDVARAFSALGDRARVFESLQTAYDERDEWMPFLNVHPDFEAFRADPRFQDFVRRVGIPTTR